ncbi:hypothetical protein ONS95_006489 [Cadophora gregata]|uniref:uncharacterized protein n=1 Tax=Cadophora gregata TaxID=51156 RepID=UPI0026DBF1C4|nr:uncharacterized protein ONS95_006489 [Cadophora gregata]KAK0101312.1 hypothetical protein ONS95_006489 [Cadophora gregata]KAK0106676.1 hypothetical protein ONS96_004296 [Cadophora gregata f. sp. sojae]
MRYLARWARQNVKTSYEPIKNESDNLSHLVDDGIPWPKKKRKAMLNSGMVEVLQGVEILLCAVVVLCNLTVLALVSFGFINISIVREASIPPLLETKTTTIFIEDPKFAARALNAASSWQNLTNNMDIGKVYIADPQRHKLFPSEIQSDIPGYDLYPVAMYHQLHCLGTIRRFFYSLEISEEDAYGGHVGHCFDYLRQSILCSADLTLENTGVGWEVEHLCRSPDEVTSFMKANNDDVRRRLMK